MMSMKVNGHTVSWFVNPEKVGKIDWSDLNHPPEETVNFEGNCDGVYVYAKRNSDGHMVRVAKAVKTMVFMPLLLGMAQFMTVLSLMQMFLYNNHDSIVLFCYAGIIIVLTSHYMLRGVECGTIKKQSR